MKKPFALFLLSLFMLAAVSCDDKDDSREGLMLEQNSLYYSKLEHTYSVGVSGGSGDYSVDIDDKSIADVGIDPEGVRLVVITKKEGETTVTVTDNNSGRQTKCSLTVKRHRDRFDIMSIRIGVDAENMADKIEADVLEHAAFPTGSTHVLIFNTDTEGEWYVKGPGAQAEELARGTFAMKQMEKFNPAFAFIPIKDQIFEIYDLELSDGETVLNYGMLIIDGKAAASRSVNMKTIHCRFYEDLTGYYKARYPEAGVKAVARVQICDPSVRIIK